MAFLEPRAYFKPNRRRTSVLARKQIDSCH